MVSGRQQLNKFVQIRAVHVDDGVSGNKTLEVHEEDNVQAKISALLTSRCHKSTFLAPACVSESGCGN